MLPTETSHPKTAALSSTIAKNTADGVRLLMQVDNDVPHTMRRVVTSPEFAGLVEALVEAIAAGKHVFFTGCGATGRLAILLEAAWRLFWQELFADRPQLRDDLPDVESAIIGVMAGGDHALICSVEGFEDSTDLGRHQLAQADVAAGDVVVAVTEGGETSFVIGTAWKGLAAGARTFFVYNNPTDVLREHVARSREVIEEPRITKLDLFTGPMAIAGSTRMQATTAELLAIGAALDLALLELLSRWLSQETLCQLNLPARQPSDYPRIFAELIEQLRLPRNIDAIAGLVEWEEGVYRNQGLVTYMTDRFLLDVLTDTTERAPTFRLPPFRKCDDAVSARSWAFVKTPRCDTRAAWLRVLRREPRGIDWPASVYQTLNVAKELRDAPPRLDNSEIRKFLIGNEPDPSRFESPDSGLAMILVGDEITQHGEPRAAFDRAFAATAASFAKTAVVGIGPVPPDRKISPQFHVACELPGSPLRLWERLATKLVLNLMSTGTMARMGRVEGNYMSRVETSNKKLIDRGTRLVAHLAGVDYETACYALHEAMDAVAEQQRTTKDAPSPVAVAVEQLRGHR
jgi:N-acetylmuramic acid 6-phosphate etherase